MQPRDVKTADDARRIIEERGLEYVKVGVFEAAQVLRRSKAGRELFGDAFIDHFAATREWEEREFRRAITDWEMERYFEII